MDNDSPGFEKLLRETSKNYPRKMIAVISGLEINAFTTDGRESHLELMKDYLSGRLSSTLMNKLLQMVLTVLFIGNILESEKKLNKQLLRS